MLQMDENTKKFYDARNKRRDQRQKRNLVHEHQSLHVALLIDLTGALSSRGITIENTDAIISELIDAGWQKGLNFGNLKPARR